MNTINTVVMAFTAEAINLSEVETMEESFAAAGSSCNAAKKPLLKPLKGHRRPAVPSDNTDFFTREGQTLGVSWNRISNHN